MVFYEQKRFVRNVPLRDVPIKHNMCTGILFFLNASQFVLVIHLQNELKIVFQTRDNPSNALVCTVVFVNFFLKELQTFPNLLCQTDLDARTGGGHLEDTVTKNLDSEWMITAQWILALLKRISQATNHVILNGKVQEWQ